MLLFIHLNCFIFDIKHFQIFFSIIFLRLHMNEQFSSGTKTPKQTNINLFMVKITVNVLTNFYY